MVTKVVSVRAVELSIGAFCTAHLNFLASGHKIEMVTNVVPVRAVEFSIGAFCTEFLCEQLCDDGIFGSGLGDRPSGPKLGLRNDSSYREGLEFASKDEKTAGPGKKS